MFILSPRLRKPLAWLALCAMCLGAVAPTVSRWLTASARAAEQVAVCSDHGVKLVDASPQPPSHQHQSAVEDDDCCPYCALARLMPYVSVAPLAVALAAPLPAARQAAAAIPAPALPARRAPQLPQAPPALA